MFRRVGAVGMATGTAAGMPPPRAAWAADWVRRDWGLPCGDGARGKIWEGAREQILREIFLHVGAS